MLSTKFHFLIILFAILFTQGISAVPVKILPLGDSITAGDGPDGAGALPSYRRFLWHSLINADYDVDFVGSQSNYTSTTILPALQDFDPDYEGWPGETAAQLNSALDGRMANYTPDIVLLHIGTNDLYAASYDTTQDATILSEIGGIITKLRTKNPNVIILLAKIIPLQSVIPVDKALNFNIKLEKEIPIYDASAPTSPAIVLVDQHTDINSPADYWDPPAIHPNENGEEKMATKWLHHLIQQQIIIDSQTGNNTTDVPFRNGLTLWLDATDIDANNIIDTITGQEVTIWKDKSGSNNDVEQIAGIGAPTLLAQELNGMPALNFHEDGLITSDADQITANSSYTKIAVFKFDSSNNNNIISSTGTALWEGDSNAIRVWHGNDEFEYVMTSSGNTIDNVNYHIVVTRYGQPNGVDNILNLDGIDVNIKPKNLQEDHIAAATNIGSLGQDDFLNGRIAEAIIYDRALSDAEISQMEDYLSTKWGLPLNTNGSAGATIIPIIQLLLLETE